MRRIFRETSHFLSLLEKHTKIIFLPSALVENLNANNEKPKESKLKKDNPMVQKIINWSDKKMVLVPGVKQTPKEPLGTSTSSSEDKDPEIAIIDNEPGASDSARNRSRKRRQECLEDKELVQNILRDDKVVRNVRQRHESGKF